MLRNYMELPERNVGSDIDILVREVHVPKILELLTKGGRIRVTSINRRAYVSTVFMDGVQHLDGRDSLQIDLVTSLSWKGSPFLAVGQVLGSAISHSTHPLVRIPAAHHEALISFFSSYLMGGWINERYQKFVQDVFIERESMVANEMAPWAGLELTSRLVLAVKEDQRDVLMRMLPEIKRRLFTHYLTRQPIVVVSEVIRHYIYELAIRCTSKPLTEICVLGMDGAGKGTVIQALLRRVGSRIKEQEVIHLKPKVRRPSREVPGTCAEPHAAPPRTKVFSVLKLLWWVALYRWHRSFHGHKNSTLIIWDRYIYDILVDPRRYRVALPHWLLGMIARLAPVPDSIVVLDVTPDIAFNRKQEVALADLVTIRQGYLELAASRSNTKVISTAGSVDESVEELLEFVSVTLANKAANGVQAWINRK